jgi:pyridoxal phosphate enzyme (YggS family)
MNSIAENLAGVRGRIEAACQRAGRDPASVKLVAVCKKKPASMVREAYEAGQKCFGENYAQELRDKAKELSDVDIDWHFIGNLQKNKAKYVAPVASMVETIDSVEIARALAERLPEGSKPLSCLIEVNIGDESSKSGVSPNGIIPFIKEVLRIPKIALKGLMILPPYDENPELSRPYFKGLRELLVLVNRELSLLEPLSELSMGMSHDFEIAIAEGATIIRVGTAIFGER